MIVYRLEDSMGLGPHRGGYYKDVCYATSWAYFSKDFKSYYDDTVKYNNICNSIRQPSPTLDGLIKSSYLRKYHKFAFPTKSSIGSWFTQTELYLLDKCGIFVKEVNINPKTSYIDEFQVAYDKRNSKNLCKFNLNTLYDYKNVNINLIKESLYWAIENSVEFETKLIKNFLTTLTPKSPLTGIDILLEDALELTKYKF